MEMSTLVVAAALVASCGGRFDLDPSDVDGVPPNSGSSVVTAPSGDGNGKGNATAADPVNGRLEWTCGSTNK
jgi:hypothetical protein